MQTDGRVLFYQEVVGVGAVLFRLDGDGRREAGFGRDGLVGASELGLSLDEVRELDAVVLGADGELTLAGRVEPNPGTPYGFLIRVTGDGPLGFAPAAAGGLLVGGPADGRTHVLNPVRETYTVAGLAEFFPGVTVRTATADVTGDGVPDLIGGAGPGGGPHVKVLDGATGTLVGEFFAFEATFTGGVLVAAADLDGDGKAEVVVTPDRGGGPVVAVYAGDTLAPLTRFFGIDDPAFRGGARPAVGDLDADGVPDLVVAAGFGGGPRVTVWDGPSVRARAPRQTANFFAFEPALRDGTFVAAGDADGDGAADLAIGAGPGGAPRVRVLGGRGLSAGRSEAIADFFDRSTSPRGGVRVAFRGGDLVTGSGDGEAGRVRVYKAATLRAGAATPDAALDVFGGAELPGGVFVG